MTSQGHDQIQDNETLPTTGSGAVGGDIQEQASGNSDVQGPRNNNCTDGTVATSAQHDLQKALQLAEQLEKLSQRYYDSNESVLEEKALLLPHFLPQDGELAQLYITSVLNFEISDDKLRSMRSNLRQKPAFLEEALGFLAYQGDIFLEQYGKRFEAARIHCRESYATRLTAIEERKLEAEQNAETCSSLLAQLARHGARKDLALKIVEQYPEFKPELMAKVVDLEAASLFARLRNSKARAQVWQEISTALESKRNRYSDEFVKACHKRSEQSPNLTKPMAKRYLELEVERMLDESRGDLSKLCVLAHQLRGAQALVRYSDQYRTWVNTALEYAAAVKNPQAVGAPIKDAISEQAHVLIEYRIKIEKLKAERDRLRESTSPKTPLEVQAFLESSEDFTARLAALNTEEESAKYDLKWKRFENARQELWRTALLCAEEQSHNTVSITAKLAGHVDKSVTSYEVATANLSDDASEYLGHFIDRCQDRILDHLRELLEAPQSSDRTLKRQFLEAGGAVVSLKVGLGDRHYPRTASIEMSDCSARAVATELSKLTFLPRAVCEGFEWTLDSSARNYNGSILVSATFKHPSVWIPCPDAVNSQLLSSLAALVEERTRRDLSSAGINKYNLLVSLRKESQT
jgi:hypothetical protein